MPRIEVTVPDSSIDVLIGDRAVDVVLAADPVSVAIKDQPVNVTLAPQFVDVLCDDVLASTFTTPTLTSVHVNATDLGAPGARMYFTAVTAGSPCRVKFKLHHASATEDYATKYSSPEELTPHATQVDITTSGDRGLTYDLYWSWTSGASSAGWALFAAAAIYVPANGEGDFPQDEP